MATQPTFPDFSSWNVTTPNPNGSPSLFTLSSKTPPAPSNYMQLAQMQQQNNQAMGNFNAALNNPNQINPYGSRQYVQNPDGTYSLNTQFSQPLQRQFDANNNLALDLYGNAQKALNTPLPTADQAGLQQVQDSLYRRQTQYLDPQYQQGQSDLENKLANQGIVRGTEAYDRAMGNFNLSKQKAYSDARDAAIQAGGAEQTRLFNLGLAAQNAPLQQLSALNQNKLTVPSFANINTVSTPATDFLGAAQTGYNQQLGLINAFNAGVANNQNNATNIASSILQSGVLNQPINAATNWLGNQISNWWNS